jgi:hypothetical protein
VIGSDEKCNLRPTEVKNVEPIVEIENVVHPCPLWHT